MVNEDFSCIKEITKIVNLTLPSMYNTNEISGISDALESWKRQYVKQLQGIVVGYKNVSLTSKRGYLKADCPVIYCNVKATFELFYPTKGSVIKGKINRISHDYIGCLVHDTINVTVHRTDDISSDISNFLVLDHYILFQITGINFKSKFIHVIGKITEECITLMKESDLFSDNINVCDNNMLSYSSPDFANRNNNHIVYNDPIIADSTTQKSSEDFDMSTDTSSQSSSRTKKKKHRKSNENFSMSNSLISGSLENDINQIELTQSFEKTKKKNRKKSDLNLTLPTNAFENEVEPIHEKNKVKPEEHIIIDTNQVELTQSSDNTRKRKRKKSHVNLDSPTNALGDKAEPMHPKKKIKIEDQDTWTNNPAINSQNIATEITNYAIKSELPSPVKKKKHKKSKNSLETPSSYSDHAVRTDIEPASSPDVNSQKDFSSFQSEEHSLTSPDIFDESLNEMKSETEPVKGKPKKKKDKLKDGSKKDKKKKDKLKDGSKKDKKKKDTLQKSSKKDKKNKKKVISTKKKLHGHSVKLKKKNRDKKSKNPKKIKKQKVCLNRQV